MKIICDADGLIKTNKAGILAMFAQHAQLFIGPEVVREVITVGKTQGYPDALEIEQIVAQHMHQTEPRSYARADLRLPEANFGAGEREALALYESEDADGILSDDRGFLSALDMHQIPYDPSGSRCCPMRVGGPFGRGGALCTCFTSPLDPQRTISYGTC